MNCPCSLCYPCYDWPALIDPQSSLADAAELQTVLHPLHDENYGGGDVCEDGDVAHEDATFWKTPADLCSLEERNLVGSKAFRGDRTLP